MKLIPVHWNPERGREVDIFHSEHWITNTTTCLPEVEMKAPSSVSFHASPELSQFDNILGSTLSRSRSTCLFTVISSHGILLIAPREHGASIWGVCTRPETCARGLRRMHESWGVCTRPEACAQGLCVRSPRRVHETCLPCTVDWSRSYPQGCVYCYDRWLSSWDSVFLLIVANVWYISSETFIGFLWKVIKQTSSSLQQRCHMTCKLSIDNFV